MRKDTKIEKAGWQPLENRSVSLVTIKGWCQISEMLVLDNTRLGNKKSNNQNKWLQVKDKGIHLFRAKEVQWAIKAAKDG